MSPINHCELQKYAQSQNEAYGAPQANPLMSKKGMTEASIL